MDGGRGQQQLAGPFSDMLSQPYRPEHVQNSGYVSAPGVVADFASKFMEGMARSRALQVYRQEVKKAQNINVLQNLAQGIVADPNRSPMDKQEILKEVQGALYGQLLTDTKKEATAKGGHPIVSFIHRAAEGVLGPQANEIPKLDSDFVTGVMNRWNATPTLMDRHRDLMSRLGKAMEGKNVETKEDFARLAMPFMTEAKMHGLDLGDIEKAFPNAPVPGSEDSLRRELSGIYGKLQSLPPANEEGPDNSFGARPALMGRKAEIEHQLKLPGPKPTVIQDRETGAMLNAWEWPQTGVLTLDHTGQTPVDSKKYVLSQKAPAPSLFWRDTNYGQTGMPTHLSAGGGVPSPVVALAPNGEYFKQPPIQRGPLTDAQETQIKANTRALNLSSDQRQAQVDAHNSADKVLSSVKVTNNVWSDANSLRTAARATNNNLVIAIIDKIVGEWITQHRKEAEANPMIAITDLRNSIARARGELLNTPPPPAASGGLVDQFMPPR